MNQSVKCVYLVAFVMCALPAISCPPTPLGWTIIDPAEPQNEEATGERYGADIAASGEATIPGVNYIVKIRNYYDDILNSKNGVSDQCSWGLTVDEPSGGWTDGTVWVNAHVQLWDGGVMKDSHRIQVK